MKKIILIAIALMAPSIASAATLSVSPASQNVNVGDTFTVNVNFDTQGSQVDGVDLRYLNYTSNLLQVVDADSSASGVQIGKGSLMPTTLGNSVDQSNGRITFSQVSLGGQKYNGSGILATVTFKAISAGTASVNFSYTSANTKDSNVASNGTDILTSVTNGSVAIGSGSSSGGGGGGGGSSSNNTTTVSGGGSSSSSSGGGSSSSSGTATGASNTSTIGNYLPPVSSGSSVIISTNLSYGAKSAEVTILQNFLVSQGLLTADNATGFFGSATEAAVKTFQRNKGIVSSGNALTTGYGAVGPSTRAFINSSSGGGSVGGSSGTQVAAQASGTAGRLPLIITRRLTLKSEGSDVVALQNFLISKGHLGVGNGTGYFGPLTQAAVQAYQRANGIVSSGTPDSTGYGAVGPSTRAMINAIFEGSAVQTSVNISGSNDIQAQIQILQAQVNELLKKLQQTQ